MPKAKKFSPGYQQLLKEINASPALLSVLYDMGILPELVDDKKTRSSRECMIALVIGFKVGVTDALSLTKRAREAAKARLEKLLKSEARNEP